MLVGVKMTRIVEALIIKLNVSINSMPAYC